MYYINNYILIMLIIREKKYNNLNLILQRSKKIYQNIRFYILRNINFLNFSK